MKVSHELWVYCKQGVDPDAGVSRLTCNREQRVMQTIYTQEEIRMEGTHLWNREADIFCFDFFLTYVHVEVLIFNKFGRISSIFV